LTGLSNQDYSNVVMDLARFTLRAKNRTYMAVSKEKYTSIKEYAGLKGLTISEATDRIVKIGLWWLITNNK
jgi:hypothetical protein